MTLKGAIFDMDGTLIDSMPVWKNIGRNYLISQGVEPPQNITEILQSMSLIDAAEYFQSEFKIPLTTENMIDGFNALLSRQYRETVLLKPEVLPFLERLRHQGVKCCVVTASDGVMAEAALSRLGLLPYFEFILTCTEAGCGKDKPLVFLRALEMLGTEKEETVVFEDALYAITTAKGAGFPVAAVYDASAEPDAEEIRRAADYYIHTFGEWEEVSR